MITNLFKLWISTFSVFVWDLKVHGLSHLWSSAGISLSRLFDYSIVLKLLTDNTVRDEKLLDAGCGDSSFPSYLTREYREVTTYDVNRKPIIFQEKIKNNFTIKNFFVAQPKQYSDKYSIKAELPFKDESFDTVTSISVLEHIADDLFALKELRRVVRSGGKVIVMVPYAPVARRPLTGENGYFQRFYTKERLLRLFESSGLSVLHAIPYTFILKSFFERFVRIYWPKRNIPFLNVGILYPISLLDLFFLRSNHFYEQRLFGRYNTPGHYAIALKKI